MDPRRFPMVSTQRRPTKDDLERAGGKTIPDRIAPGLDVLFVGINPSLYSAAVGHHFGRPGNRFWPALHGSGFTPHLLAPEQDGRLLEYGAGLTNLVGRATARADELDASELRRGARTLARKLRRYQPRWVAFVGVTAYRTAYEEPKARLGRQSRVIAHTPVWVLPNPSGLNAHYQLPDLVRLFAQLRATIRSEG